MKDMTVGAAHSHLWRYALPILIGNWLQLAYNAVDSMIAGRFIGRQALAAEATARRRRFSRRSCPSAKSSYRARSTRWAST